MPSLRLDEIEEILAEENDELTEDEIQERTRERKRKELKKFKKGFDD